MGPQHFGKEEEVMVREKDNKGKEAAKAAAAVEWAPQQDMGPSQLQG